MLKDHAMAFAHAAWVPAHFELATARESQFPDLQAMFNGETWEWFEFLEWLSSCHRSAMKEERYVVAWDFQSDVLDLGCWGGRGGLCGLGRWLFGGDFRVVNFERRVDIFGGVRGERFVGRAPPE